MKHATVALLPLLAGCMTQASFYDEFVPTYCDWHETCNTGGLPCPVTLDDARPASDCEFDSSAARECLDGVFTCDETIDGFEVVTTPDACESARICGF